MKQQPDGTHTRQKVVEIEPTRAKLLSCYPYGDDDNNGFLTIIDRAGDMKKEV